jgi:hypothetical protein
VTWCLKLWNILTLYSDHHNSSSQVNRRQITSVDDGLDLELVLNKGPLLIIAIALFGEGSFIPTRMAHPEAYAGLTRDKTNSTSVTGWASNAGSCTDLAPLGFLLADNVGQGVVGNSIATCMTNTDGGPGGSRVDIEIANWIDNFRYLPERLRNAYTAAAFLANQAWMQEMDGMNPKSLYITYDLGGDTSVPVISHKGVILISVLLLLYLLSLLSMATYATVFPRWTSQLDSFAMMRIGAAVPDKFPLLIAPRVSSIKALDETPGWLGDEVDDTEDIGRLGLGASGKLRGGRMYASYSSGVTY